MLFCEAIISMGRAYKIIHTKTPWYTCIYFDDWADMALGLYFVTGWDILCLTLLQTVPQARVCLYHLHILEINSTTVLYVAVDYYV